MLVIFAALVCFIVAAILACVPAPASRFALALIAAGLALLTLTHVHLG